MNTNILNGREVAQSIQSEVKQTVAEQLANGSLPPGIAVVLVGDNPASQIYVENKRKACQKVGFNSQLYCLPSSVDEQELLALITQLNQDNQIHGILVQLPLPEHINADNVVEHLAPAKDIDGFHPYNLGRLAQRRPLLRPCTPFGIIRLLQYYDLPLRGLHATIVGASNIVGRPMALELLLASATVTVCHRFTQDLATHVQAADLLVVATGRRGLIDVNWLKPNSIIVDVGIHRLDDGTVCGDLDFTAAAKHARWITPVPGGVGPMTIATLLTNTLFAYEQLTQS